MDDMPDCVRNVVVPWLTYEIVLLIISSHRVVDSRVSYDGRSVDCCVGCPNVVDDDMVQDQLFSPSLWDVVGDVCNVTVMWSVRGIVINIMVSDISDGAR